MKKNKKLGFLELAKSRKTTYEFNDKGVKNNDIKKILEAGRWAPSCSNIQPWHFIVVKNKKRISEIMKTSYYGAFHTNSNVIIALVLKKNMSESEHRCIKNKKISFLEGNLCIAMAAMSMIFEAEDLGVDSCILSPEQKIISKILKIKEDCEIPLMLGVGYEKEGAYRKKRERIDVNKLISYEYYGGK